MIFEMLSVTGTLVSERADTFFDGVKAPNRGVSAG